MKQPVSVIIARFGAAPNEISCRGCREENGKPKHFSDGCAIFRCVMLRNVDYCCDCEEFPCYLLSPVAEDIENCPQNLKVFNLCRIKKVGIENWIKEAGAIRKKYFTMKFVVGKGQAD